MYYLQQFRQWAFNFRKSLFHHQQKKPERVMQPGLPPGLEEEVIQTVCQDHFNNPIKSITYQHLSGWKTSGAYRLYINHLNGRQSRLIYKQAIYGYEDIPALADLPVCPGLPEFTVLSQPFGALKPYLPQVFYAEERLPGKNYNYLVEDLAVNFHQASGTGGALQVSKQLPDLHLALNDWAEQSNTLGFLDYGLKFSRSLQNYAFSKLEMYRQHEDNPLLNAVLSNWKEISALHTHPAFFTLQPSIAIHGDTNYTNIYLHNNDPDQMKVVDWEWAGFGSPFADLVSMLKAISGQPERKAVNTFIHYAQKSRSGLMLGLSGEQYHQLYYWSQIERGLLDASFLSVQRLHAPTQGHINFSAAINKALQRVLEAYQQLAG